MSFAAEEPFNPFIMPPAPWVGQANQLDGSFQNAVSYAQQAVSTAQSFINALANGVSDIQPPTIEVDWPALPTAPPLHSTAAPTLAHIDAQFPTAPSPFEAQDLDINQFLPEPFDGIAPELSIGPAPVFNKQSPDAPGIDYDLQAPEFTGLTLPATPSLLSISIAPFDGVTLPDEPEGDIPELSLVEPQVIPYEPGELYTSQLLTTLKTTLHDRITNGGTGLNPVVEKAIWDREREREAIATRDALDELDRMESMGFALPPGVYMAQRQRITTEMHARTVSLGRDIAIKQAELELENVRMALEQATGLEGRLIDYANQVEQRAFEAVRYATEAGVQIYNAKVQAYDSLVRAYQARITIYEAKIRGALAAVEVYRAQVDAERAKADVNNAMVQAYTAQIQGALATVEVFRAEIQAVTAKADIEKTKAEIFGSQVQAFAAQANAYSAEVGGYRAGIDAETAKTQAYRAQVDAYTADVQGKVAAIRGNVDVLQSKLAVKNNEWEGYKAMAAAAADKARTVSAQNSLLVDSFRAATAVDAAYNEVLTKQWQVGIDQAQRVTEVGVASAKANAELYVTSRSLALDASKVGAQVSSQLAAAALNAVNYSYGFSESNSYGVSNQASNSSQRQGSTSDQHIYNYERD